MVESLRIVRVLSVVDTREYVEDGDRWVPVPGSGDLHECSRCGRVHEVHATVELSDGSTSLVGTGCAKGEEAEIVRALTNGANAAKRTKILERTIARELERVAAWDAKAAEFDAMPFPAILETFRPCPVEETKWGRRGRLILSAGGSQVWCGDYLTLAEMPAADRAERLECLRTSVRTDYCGGHGRRSYQLEAARGDLAKHLRRLASNRPA